MQLQLLAHVKWFTSDEAQKMPGLSINEFLLIFGCIFVALVGLHLFDIWCAKKKITQTIDAKMAPYQPWVPTIVRISAALLLLLNTFANYILAPNIEKTGTFSESFLTATFTIAGILLLLGLFTRLGAGMMIIGYILSFVLLDWVQPLDHLEYLGLGIYLLLEGGGRWSLDKTVFTSRSEWLKHSHYALPALRISVGAGLSILAFSEKLLNVGMSQQFLNNYHWNFLHSIGATDRFFILMAGTVELIIGFSLILNIATRVTTLALLGVMTLTAILLGPTEIAGHIFAVGVVAAIWVSNSNDSRKIKQNPTISLKKQQ